MRPVSIEDFIRIIHADDTSPPSPATIRKQCGRRDDSGAPLIPGAYKIGKPWKIDLDVYLPEMRRRITGEGADLDDDESAFLNEIALRLAS
jgi:hypothetical protein